jgi:hypothetical protein
MPKMNRDFEADREGAVLLDRFGDVIRSLPEAIRVRCTARATGHALQRIVKALKRMRSRSKASDPGEPGAAPAPAGM